MGKKKKNYDPLKEVLKHARNKDENTLKQELLKINGDRKKDVLNKAMFRCSIEGNKDGLDMLLDTCPKELKQDIVKNLIKKFLLDNRKDATSLIIKSCKPQEFRREVLSQLMHEYVLKDHKESISMLIESCKADDSKAMLALTMKNFLIESDLEKVRKIKIICPEEYKGYVLGFAFTCCIYQNYEEGMQFIKDICPEGSQKEMYKYAMGTSVLNYNDEVSQLIYKITPHKEFKNEMLSHALSVCSFDTDPKRAFKTLFDCFSDDITENTFIDAIVQNAEENEINDISILMEVCPEEMYIENIVYNAIIDGAKKNNEKIPSKIYEAFHNQITYFHIFFAEAMIFFAKNNNKKALETLVGACPEELRHPVYLHVIENFVNKDDFNLEAIKLIYEVCHEDRKVHMLANALVTCAATEEIKDKTNSILEICPESKEKYLFLKALFICIDKKDNETLETIYNLCSEDHKVYEISQAMIYSIEEELNDQFKTVKELCLKEGIEIEVFAKALVTSTEYDNQETLARLKTEIPTGKELSIYGLAIVNAAQKNDEKNLSLLIKNCPEFLKEKIVTEAILISAFKNNEDSLSLIKKVGSEVIDDHIIGTAMSICAIQKNEYVLALMREVFNNTKQSFATAMKIALIEYNDLEALEILNRSCPEDLKSEVFSLALNKVFFNSKKNIEHIEMLFKVSPEDLKPEMFTNLLHGSVITPFPEGVSWVHQNCPESIRIEVYAKLLAFSAIKDSTDKPYLIAQDTFPEEIQQKVYTQALEIAAQQKNDEAIKKITNSYINSEEEKIKMYANALANCTFMNLSDALNILIEACPKDIKEKALIEAPIIYDEKVKLNLLGSLLAIGAAIKNSTRENTKITAKIKSDAIAKKNRLKSPFRKR